MLKYQIKVFGLFFCQSFMVGVFDGGAVRNRTAVRNLATPGVYMLREVVKSRLASHNLQSYTRPSLKSSS